MPRSRVSGGGVFKHPHTRSWKIQTDTGARVKCGIRGSLGHFLQNLLSERSFKVRVGNQLSEKFLQIKVTIPP